MQKLKRQSLRLPHYDYASPGWYFVTVCTSERQQVFGRIKKGKMYLSEIGRIVEDIWKQTSAIRPNVRLDEFVVMPDHMHMIVYIETRGDCREDGGVCNTPRRQKTKFQSPSQTLGAIIRGFKAASTRSANQHLKTSGFPIWQSNYYEHIVRTEAALNRIRQYIHDNPSKWKIDPHDR